MYIYKIRNLLTDKNVQPKPLGLKTFSGFFRILPLRGLNGGVHGTFNVKISVPVNE